MDTIDWYLFHKNAHFEIANRYFLWVTAYVILCFLGGAVFSIVYALGLPWGDTFEPLLKPIESQRKYEWIAVMFGVLLTLAQSAHGVWFHQMAAKNCEYKPMKDNFVSV